MNTIKRDYVGISLWITSENLTVDTISRLVGIEPTYSQKLGDVVGQTKRRYERHAWNLGRRLYGEQGIYIGSQTEQFFNDFLYEISDFSSRISELSRQHSVSLEIIYNLLEMPFVGLTSEQIKLIAGLGARVSFDVMVRGGGSE